MEPNVGSSLEDALARMTGMLSWLEHVRKTKDKPVYGLRLCCTGAHNAVDGCIDSSGVGYARRQGSYIVLCFQKTHRTAITAVTSRRIELGATK